MRLIFFLLAFSLLHADNPSAPQYNITSHEILLNGEPMEYTAIAGTIPLFNNEGKTSAEIFFIAYHAEEEKEDRPITFVLPGGPGGAGTLEAILVYGPRRLLTAGEGRSILPPYKFIDNPETILPFTDLVYIDPVNCGFSRVTEDGNLNYFYSVEGDLHSLGEFIRTYISCFDKWNCPKYLSGGSYGTPRCCGLALNLLAYDIALSGIILHGCALDFSTLIGQRDQSLPDCLLIPTFAATAWYYGRLWPEKNLSEVVDYARRFAFDEYAPAMLQPSRLGRDEKEAFHQRLSEIIGLPVSTVKRYNARIDERIYCQEFFAPERQKLGGLDTRFAGDVSSIDPDHDNDPSYLDSLGAQCALQSYLQRELDTSYPYSNYVGFSFDANSNWYFGTYDSFGTPNLLQRLRRALIFNPRLKVFIGSGYYDCRTPFAATEFSFDHLDLAPSYQKNLQFEYYEAGHGYIYDIGSLKKLKGDLTRFYGQ